MSGKKQVADLHAMADQERKARLLLEVCVVKVALEHPDMPIALLAERFGKTENEINSILRSYRVERERDMISSWANARHRYTRYGT